MALQWLNSTASAIASFFRRALSADPLKQRRTTAEFDAFARWENRILRYDLFWSMYQNNAFAQDVHDWSNLLKQQFGLYRHVRGVFNPAYRLGEFWAAHIWGGPLDPKAGDGSRERTAIPILTANAAIRPALAKLWAESNFVQKKAVASRFGAVLGDVGLQAVDDPVAQKVVLRVVHPGHIKWIDRDDSGRVRSYILEEIRLDPRIIPIQDISPLIDPRSIRRTVTYNEEAFIEGDEVVYRTYLNGTPFDWRGAQGDGEEYPPEWRVPYPFIPFEVCSHIDCNLDFGMSEFHALVAKSFEIDDIASIFNDQTRKILQAPKLICGATRLQTDIFVSPGANNQPSDNNPEPDRQNLKYIGTGSSDVKAYDLTVEMDLDGVGKQEDRIIDELERDFPELQMDVWAKGDRSGRAMKIARNRTDVKVQERRVAYDNALVRIQKTALLIGGMRGYPGYEGFDLAAYHAGKLDHAIAHRPVFAPDPLDDIEEANAFWTAAAMAVSAGCPLAGFLKAQGWDDDDIQELVDAQEQFGELAPPEPKAAQGAKEAAATPTGNPKDAAYLATKEEAESRPIRAPG